ncbi:hypothetical protein JCM7686_1004 [Paracoccus aminophilus JCM 7686]|uniref:Uncharacterized protein n=1 Tax=Paracoccus aminophilus JCM 7686 TaxID=1367847 RepID=S5Y9T2_PARAH|nr:hypothetical protein JCM7686_1004 [Paracoccus aminophilus JCM 7686]
MKLRAGAHTLSYVADPDTTVETPLDQLEIAENLDRAYTVSDSGQVRRITIARDKWPLRAVACHEFKTSMFESAQVRCLFKVTEVIPYEWSAFNRLYEVPLAQARRARSFATEQIG